MRGSSEYISNVTLCHKIAESNGYVSRVNIGRTKGPNKDEADTLS
jgi:hypothetical protein